VVCIIKNTWIDGCRTRYFDISNCTKTMARTDDVHLCREKFDIVGAKKTIQSIRQVIKLKRHLYLQGLALPGECQRRTARWHVQNIVDKRSTILDAFLHFHGT